MSVPRGRAGETRLLTSSGILISSVAKSAGTIFQRSLKDGHHSARPIAAVEANKRRLKLVFTDITGFYLSVLLNRAETTVKANIFLPPPTPIRGKSLVRAVKVFDKSRKTDARFYRDSPLLNRAVTRVKVRSICLLGNHSS